MSLDILLPGDAGSKRSLSDSSDKILQIAKSQLEEYFAGARRAFDLPLLLQGTGFQKSVWHQISEIEFGDQVSYGEIAKAISNPVASRAVGAAVGANWFPILIPCHRVLGSSKKITGYSGGQGIATKKWLLDYEGIEYFD